MSGTLRVGLVQHRCDDDPATNLERAVEWWTKAAGQGFENAQEVLREHGVNENKWPTTTD